MKKDLWVHILILLAALLLVCYFTGCKTKIQYVPIESVKTEYKDKLVKDSVYILDSVFLYSRNDTVFLNKYKYIYKDKLIKDTLSRDSIVQVPYPVKGDTVYINKLKWYQEASVWFTSAVFVLLLLYLGIKYRGKIFTLFRKLIFKI